MDDTIAHHIYDFFLPVLQLSNHKVDDSATHIVRLNYSLYSEYFQRIFGFTKADHYVSDISKQFFINFALGFSNRKCCLYLNPAMPFNQKEALNQTMAWMSDKKVNNSLSKENIKISSRSNAGTG
uniref:ULP_PROTEASE domain-containing protein n=1 Tax=Rhabditophanes sp. KR3021 TaxID=114890 RepID=A0AC35TZ32_9BILA